MTRRRNDLLELMPKEVGTKQHVPRILWKLVQYWACLTAFLSPKRKPLAMTGKLILMNCIYWDCETHHYLMRIKNCRQALAADGTPRPAKMLVGKPLWQISWLQCRCFGRRCGENHKSLNDGSKSAVLENVLSCNDEVHTWTTDTNNLIL